MIQMTCKCCGAPLKHINQFTYGCDYCNVEYILEKDELNYAPWYEVQKVNYNRAIATKPIDNWWLERDPSGYQECVKEQLAIDLARCILKEGAIEFTEYIDIANYDKPLKCIRAELKYVDGKQHMEFIRKER